MNDLENTIATANSPQPWNKGKLTGSKPPLRPKHVWLIRTKLQTEGRVRDLAMFNLLPGIEVDDALAIAEQVDI